MDEASQPFIGQWQKLVSTTNWEKGRIIAEWRDALVAAGAGVSQYADDAWASRVGGVTPQHVGRLRRVYQRFGDTYAQYAGLYWSHFQAAVEWTDAEMWLEGAVQNDWSVASMRQVRSETLGVADALTPADGPIAATEPEEDYVPDSSPRGDSPDADSAARESSSQFDGGPRAEGPDFGDEADGGSYDSTPFGSTVATDDAANDADLALDAGGAPKTPVETVRPFANLAPLPDDLAEPFDAFKLAMLRHKTDGWRQVSCDDVVAALEALRALALAPPDKG